MDGLALVCPSCAAALAADDRFCESCGARVDSDAAPASACAACGGGPIDEDGYCQRCGHRTRPAEDRIELYLPWAAAVSDRGKRHRHNEDAFGLRQATAPEGVPATLAVVCDGVSTAGRPGDAARAAVEAGLAALADAFTAGADHLSATRTAAAAAAAAVVALAAPETDAPACTYVSAVVTAGSVTVGWLGDSRAYWLSPDGTGTQLTEDDSWAAQMVASGELPPDRAYADRRAHALVAWLGADAGDATVRVATHVPPGPGMVLVCSDGLWNYLPGAAQLAAFVFGDVSGDVSGGVARPRLETARALVRHALDAGGHDNITVALLPVGLAVEGQAP
jgi:serine/threonine protein phosphatase PrpC